MRTILFAVVIPATVIVYVPWLLVERTAALPADGAAWPIGVIVIVAGAALLVICWAGFIVDGQGTPAPYDPPRRLVTGALYRRVRNPIYLALLVILIGEAIAFTSWALAAWLAIMAVSFHLVVVVYEEPDLRARFGGAYEDYLRSVPRWIPRR
ncbi:MAG TPA: isoprenylcysteine carboxylmethyltransferase family protein [Candidatus Acidoferrales bacterium]|nr:isoprenylcysteine carboxylmethyltransferase family protein [Candidatus Acidoferrales bacterium]